MNSGHLLGFLTTLGGPRLSCARGSRDTPGGHWSHALLMFLMQWSLCSYLLKGKNSEERYGQFKQKFILQNKAKSPKERLEQAVPEERGDVATQWVLWCVCVCIHFYFSFCVCLCLCFGMDTRIQCPQLPEVSKPCGVGVTGVWEPPDVGARNQAQSFAGAGGTLHSRNQNHNVDRILIF